MDDRDGVQEGVEGMDDRDGVDVLLLDVGGVIVPPANPAAVARVERALGLVTGELGALLYEWEPWYALSTGRTDVAAYWAALGARVGWEPAALASLLRPVWEPAGIDPEVIGLVRAVRSRMRVAVLSNATLALERQLAGFGVRDLFDPIINSARVGLRKPDPRIFQHAIDVLGVPANRILFVDDKQRNTRVAEDLGIPGVVYTAAPDLRDALMRCHLLPPGTL